MGGQQWRQMCLICNLRPHVPQDTPQNGCHRLVDGFSLLRVKVQLLKDIEVRILRKLFFR